MELAIRVVHQPYRAIKDDKLPLFEDCFFCLAREFWNQTCVTRLLNPVCLAIRSRSWPSGFGSILKFAVSIWSWSSENVVRILFGFSSDPCSVLKWLRGIEKLGSLWYSHCNGNRQSTYHHHLDRRHWPPVARYNEPCSTPSYLEVQTLLPSTIVWHKQRMRNTPSDKHYSLLCVPNH